MTNGLPIDIVVNFGLKMDSLDASVPNGLNGIAFSNLGGWKGNWGFDVCSAAGLVGGVDGDFESHVGTGLAQVVSGVG